MLKNFLIALALSAVVGLACTRSADDGVTPVALDLDASEAEFAPDLSDEWRWGWEVAGPKTYSITLGTAPADSTLRFSLRDSALNDGAVEARVYLGDELQESLASAGDGQWQDFEIPLPAEATSRTCRLEFDAQHHVVFGPVEIITEGAAASKKPNVVVVLIDTLRQDRLGCYGYDRPTSPNIDAFAKDAVRFTEMMPQASWTRPSVGSLFTSVYPHVHQATDTFQAMRRDLTRWTAPFKDAGYEARAIHSNPHILPVTGLGYGFDTYAYIDSDATGDTDDALVIDEALAQLEYMDGQPWFLYVHCMGPHVPYDPPEPYASRFVQASYPGDEQAQERARIPDQYDAEIAYTDEQFGRLMSALKEKGYYDDAIIVVLSDHGEEFWEHGQLGHAKSLYEEVLKIPFLIKLPDEAQGGETRENLVQLIDVAPTLTDLAGLKSPEGWMGESLADVIEGTETDSGMGFAFHSNLDNRLRAVKSGNRKLIEDLVAERAEYYDLEQDPGEQAPQSPPGSEAAALARAVREIELMGNSGIHILATSPYDSGRTITGRIVAAADAPAELYHPEGESKLAKSADAWEFTFNFDRPREDSLRAKHGDQDVARIRLETPPNEEVQIQLLMDGKPLPHDRIKVAGDAVDADGASVTVRGDAIIDMPSKYSPETLPEKTAVYIWYAPESATLTEDAIDEEMEQDLRALGYLE